MMQWLVGIDEAGYGPHLGPLVQAATAIGVDEPTECLWAKYTSAIRKASDDDDGRIAIDDSKLVHVGTNKFARLESNLLRALNLPSQVSNIACNESVADLRGEPWYVHDEEATVTDQQANHAIECQFVRSVITPTPRFNRLVDEHGTKAAALSRGVISLMQLTAELLPENEAICFVIDKQGGRNSYAPMISTAFPDGWVHVKKESATCSEYEIQGLARTIQLTFRPKAESACMPVALASMVAKYLRERLMRQFNTYWQQHVPDLEPTAGYSTDARRYYTKIRPAMRRLGIAPQLVWRKR